MGSRRPYPTPSGTGKQVTYGTTGTGPALYVRTECGNGGRRPGSGANMRWGWTGAHVSPGPRWAFGHQPGSGICGQVRWPKATLLRGRVAVGAASPGGRGARDRGQPRGTSNTCTGAGAARSPEPGGCACAQAKGRRGRSAVCGPDLRWPVRSSVAGASAHRGAAGRARRALPGMEGGHVAPGPGPQDRPARGSGGRGPLLPPALLHLLLQDPTHNLVLPELLLLREGAAGKRRLG